MEKLNDIPSFSDIDLQIDGIFEEEAWKKSKTIEITPFNQLYLMQDEEYLFIGIFNNEDVARYVDLYIDTDTIGLLNLHASFQLGERILGEDWDDSTPEWNWGNNTLWRANKVVEVESEDENITFLESVKPYQGHEFQISKSKFHNKEVRIRLEIKDFVGQAREIIFPLESERADTRNWLLIKLD